MDVNSFGGYGTARSNKDEQQHGKFKLRVKPAEVWATPRAVAWFTGVRRTVRQRALHI